MQKHLPVMLNEVIDNLNIRPDGIYLDLTLGRAGHSMEILKRLKSGFLIAFDKDVQAIKESEPHLRKISNNFKLIHSDYKNLKIELEKLEIKSVDGILLDLGVSSPQLDDLSRGFSYSNRTTLDMRMDQSQSLTAHEIVNNWSEEELSKIFYDYADVMLPKKVAKSIVENRPINFSDELVEIIKKSLPAALIRKKNYAKSVFQALRIAVNDELNSLKKVLVDAPNFLNKNSSLLVITFHSIEDRIVKKVFVKFVDDITGKLPIVIEKKWQTKSINPTNQEVLMNKRSRSSKLRILKKIKD